MKLLVYVLIYLYLCIRIKKRLMLNIIRNSVQVIKLWFVVIFIDILFFNDLKVVLKIRILIIKDMILIINV